jgi:hypothetical protein
VRNIADLTLSPSCFCSKNEPNQSISWDFHELLIGPTHYMISRAWLKSWVVETSLDGEDWTVIDRQIDNGTFTTDSGYGTLFSFAVSTSPECRFFRLPQTATNLRGSDHLVIVRFVIFGTLRE